MSIDQFAVGVSLMNEKDGATKKGDSQIDGG